MIRLFGPPRPTKYSEARRDPHGRQAPPHADGQEKQPTYRVVAADSRSPRNGRFIEIIGTYEPRLNPSVIKIDDERAVHWLANGAQPTDQVEKLLKISGAWTEHTGEAFDATVPERAARKSKKQLEKEAGLRRLRLRGGGCRRRRG